MRRPTNSPASSRLPSCTKAEIIEKHLFRRMSEQELSRQYGVSKRDIGAWRDLVRQGLESFFSEGGKIETICRELTLLKKALGEA